MRSGTIRTSLCILIAALVLAPVAVADSTGGAAKVDARWSKAMLAGDLEGVMSCYGKASTLWFPGEAMAKGTDQIRAAYTGFLGAFTVKSINFADVQYKTSGNLSTAWGRYTMVVAPKNGGADVTMTGRFTEIAMRYKASWVYIADHASADPAPAAPAKK